MVETFADLYRLKADDIAHLGSEVEQGDKLVKRTIGEKVANKVIAQIEKSRQQGWERLLAGLGIKHVGNRVAYILASNFGSLDAIEAATQEQLSEVNEIGPAIADSVHDFFHNAAGRKAIEELKKAGIDPTMEVKKPEETANLPLAGKTIVVTGTLPTMSRPEIEELITKLGGKASGSVSKKTSFLVAGEEAGGKLAKAKDLGVEVLTEGEFLRRVGQNATAAK